MASLSTCHLDLWLGWQILLNLVKKVLSLDLIWYFFHILNCMFTYFHSTSFPAGKLVQKRTSHIKKVPPVPVISCERKARNDSDNEVSRLRRQMEQMKEAMKSEKAKSTIEVT